MTADAKKMHDRSEQLDNTSSIMASDTGSLDMPAHAAEFGGHKITGYYVSDHGRGRWLILGISVALVAAIVAVFLGVSSVLHPSDATQQQEDTEANASQSKEEESSAQTVAKMASSLEYNGANVSLPLDRIQVDINDGHVMITYKTRENYPATYARITGAAMALASDLKDQMLENSTTRKGVSDELIPPTVDPSVVDKNTKTKKYSWFSQKQDQPLNKVVTSKDVSFDPQLATSLSKGSAKVSDVTLCALGGSNEVCAAISVDPHNIKDHMSSDEIALSSLAYGFSDECWKEMQKAWYQEQLNQKKDWNSWILAPSKDDKKERPKQFNGTITSPWSYSVVVGKLQAQEEDTNSWDYWSSNGDGSDQQNGDTSSNSNANSGDTSQAEKTHDSSSNKQDTAGAGASSQAAPAQNAASTQSAPAASAGPSQPAATANAGATTEAAPQTGAPATGSTGQAQQSATAQ